jgi:serine/threonine protein kinase
MDGFPYVLGALLGEGSFCQVFHGTHLETKRQVAVKVAYKSHFTGTSVAQRVDSELAVLRKAQHPNIVKLIGVFDLPESINIVLVRV